MIVVSLMTKDCRSLFGLALPRRNRFQYLVFKKFN